MSSDHVIMPDDYRSLLAESGPGTDVPQVARDPLAQFKTIVGPGHRKYDYLLGGYFR